jgi:hypothetical protein
MALVYRKPGFSSTEKVTVSADNAFDSSNVVSNQNGSLLERAEALQEQLGGTTPNNGLYSNRIVLMSPSADYTEVCFKSGSTSYDAHTAGQSTAGGNCVPGDVGFIIERSERSANYWELAKQTCLQQGMRLPEPFEWKLSCKNTATWGLSGMTGNDEWESNSGILLSNGGSGMFTSVAGASGCAYSGYGWISSGAVAENSNAFRCMR